PHTRHPRTLGPGTAHNAGTSTTRHDQHPTPLNEAPTGHLPRRPIRIAGVSLVVAEIDAPDATRDHAGQVIPIRFAASRSGFRPLPPADKRHIRVGPRKSALSGGRNGATT